MRARSDNASGAPEDRDASATLHSLCAEVSSRLPDDASDQWSFASGIPAVSFIRLARPTDLATGILQPSICLVLQGRKRILLGSQVMQYGAGSFVAAAIDMPAAGHVVQASLTAPYLGVRLDLDPKEMAAVVLDSRLPAPKTRKTRAGAYVSRANPDLEEAFLRLVRLADQPRDIPILSRLIRQEIIYRLLSGKNGEVLYQNVLPGVQQRGINEAIAWIKTHYTQPLNIERLAKLVHMSTSTLHHRFKATTTMSPLQYQKQLRLTEARKILLGGNVEAAAVAFSVGYESPSQFSREYRRVFGAPPLQDIQHYAAATAQIPAP